MNLSSVRYVLFDAVGTLIAAHPNVSEVYASIGKQFGSQRTAAEIKPRFMAALEGANSQRVSLNEAEERLRWQRIVASVLDDADDPAGQMFAALWQHFAEPAHWRLYDEVEAAWRAVIESGRKPGIASNFDARLRTVCAGLPPLTECETLLLSSEIGYAKPDGRYFTAVGEILGARPAEILLVGDDLQCDYHGALAAGWQALLLDREQRHVLPQTIASLHELAALLRASS